VGRGRGGDVDRPRPTEHPDDQVAQAGHDVGSGAGAGLGAVLTEGDVADVAQRLDRPVPPQQVGEPGGAGLLEREAGDGIDGHGREPPRVAVEVAGLAGDLQDLGGVGAPEVVDADGLEGAQLDAAVAAVTGAVQQGRLVGLDHEQVVRLLLGHQELGGLRVGLERIGGDQ
jgi:hypothetical protein